MSSLCSSPNCTTAPHHLIEEDLHLLGCQLADVVGQTLGTDGTLFALGLALTIPAFGHT
jgi:hypothetical protein